MKNYSCEITIRHRDLDIFDLTKATGRSDRNDFLSLAIDASLRLKYTSFQLAPLYRALPTAAFPTQFTLVRTVQVDSETSQTSYTYQIPPASRIVIRPFEEGRDSQPLTQDRIVTTMNATSAHDARAGSGLLRIRKKRGAPAANMNGPIGTSRNEQIRAVRETKWED